MGGMWNDLEKFSCIVVVQDVAKLQSTPLLKVSVVDEAVMLSFRGTPCGVCTELAGVAQVPSNSFVHIKSVEPVAFSSKEEPMKRFQLVDSQGWAVPVDLYLWDLWSESK